jgi:serine/threonine protein kinase
VHKQKLVHRDIKPSNIMVSLEEGGAVTAKIIDLGLAKTVDEAGSDTAISIPGRFAGTPEFASPEQFAGVGVDIRSDLYSLGVTLWEMVTGHQLFRGSPAEVMYQHQHASLPREQLEDVPQPVVALLEVLLEKDPGRRFQNPAELLKVIPTITGALDSRRRVTRQSFQKTPLANMRVGPRKSAARLGPKKIPVARLPITGSDVFGREEDIAFLDDAWANQQVNVVTIVAWAVLGNLRSLTIGSEGWQLNIIGLRSSFSDGPFTDREAVEAPRPRMNFLTLLSVGLEIQIHGSERRGRRAKDWRS